jgi:hypothetical protein
MVRYRYDVGRGEEMGSDTINRKDTFDAINTWDKFGIDEIDQVLQ